MTDIDESPFGDDHVYEVVGPKPIALQPQQEDALDEELRFERERAEFLQEMDKYRQSFAENVLEAALGWNDNVTSLRHCQALQEAVIKLRTYDRDCLRKYVKKFSPSADDQLVQYLNDLEEKLG